MLSNSVNLFSENMHSSASLTGMSLTKISFVPQCMSDCSCAKCPTVCTATEPMKLMAWPTSLKVVWAVLQLLRICIYSDTCHSDFHFPSIFCLFFFNRILFIFHAFWSLRISELWLDHASTISSTFRRTGSLLLVVLFMNVLHKVLKAVLSWVVGRRQGPDSALIKNSGGTVAEKTGMCHVVLRYTALFIKPCINIRPCKLLENSSSAAQEKIVFSCIVSAALPEAPLGCATTASTSGRWAFVMN